MAVLPIESSGVFRAIEATSAPRAQSSLAKPLPQQPEAPEPPSLLARALTGEVTAKRRREPRKLENAVVVGAGPSGLASAIKLRQLGLEVTLVEKRDADNPTLPVALALRQGFLDRLADLGCLDEARPFFSAIERIEVDDDEAGVSTREPASARPADPARVTSDARALLSGGSVVMIRLADLNRVLTARAQALGVLVSSFSDVELTPSGESYRVTLRQLSPGKHEPTGKMVDLGVPDLVVVADGAGSSTRTQLGIELEVFPEADTYIGGSFRGAELGEAGGAVSRHYVERQNGVLRGVAHSIPKAKSTWVVVQVPEKVTFEKPEDATAFFRERALRALGERAKKENIEWGGNRTFTVRPQVAKRSTAGDNVVLVGDSSRAGHFLAAAGCNLGMIADVRSLEALVTSGRDGTLAWSDALKLFGVRSRMAGLEWVRAGHKYFASVDDAEAL